MPGSRAVSEQQVRHMAYWRGMQLRWAGGGRFSLSDGKGTVARGLFEQAAHLAAQQDRADA
jgi:hypothetical protein